MKSSRFFRPISMMCIMVLFLAIRGFSQEFPIGAQGAVWDYHSCMTEVCDPADLQYITEAGFNLLWSSDEDILNAAENHGIDIVFFGTEWAFQHWNDGQYVVYESDLHEQPYYTFAKFSHDNVVGQEINDPFDTDNNFAWQVQEGEHPAGYAQRDLIVNNQQDAGINYTANFRMKINDNSGHQHLATLYAVGIDPNDQSEVVLNSQQVYTDEFASAGQYQMFDVAFTPQAVSNPLNEDIPLHLSHATSISHLMDFRVHWTGIRQLSIDRVEVSDALAEPLLAGNHDASLQSDISDYSSYPALYRFYIKDEPSEVNFPSEAYINSFLVAGNATGLTNAFPEYGEIVAGALDAPDYETYVQEYMDYMNPNEIMTNHLTYQSQFYNNTNGPRLGGYIENLDLFRQQSLSTGKDFWMTVQAFGDGDLSWMSLDEVGIRTSASVWTALAYGARGIMYWAINRGAGNILDWEGISTTGQEI